MSIEVNKQPFRDYMIEQIKAAGQELINRAEEMISEDSKYVTDFNINIHIPGQNDGELPTISWATEVICKTGAEIIVGGID